MTTKPKVRRYRVRRGASLTEGLNPAATPDAAETGPVPTAETAPPGGQAAPQDAPPAIDIAAIEAEGLTSRQLRMARRTAARNGLAVRSDFDAVSQLRALGIDPFRPGTILDLVAKPAANENSPGAADLPAAPSPRPVTAPTQDAPIQLPRTVAEPQRNLPSRDRVMSPDTRLGDIVAIQRDIVRRRRRNFLALMARLIVFIGLPTLAAGIYFYRIATPMFATKSEFVIQQAEATSAAGLGGLFQGTSMATQQDSMTVQSYLTSRAALARLDADHGFTDHFSDPAIDLLRRLPPDGSNEQAFKVYSDHVRIGYDPSEGIIRMEVIAADPETSQRFSEALIGYAEEQVDQLTQRLREDQMAGARESYLEAEQRRATALAEWLSIQQQVQQIDPVGETSARMQQIGNLEADRQRLMLALETRLSVESPNEAQVNSLRMQIDNIDTMIGDLRSSMTEESLSGASLASRNTELRVAEENYTFQTLLVQQALQQMETARIEANRQVRYLSLGVEPIAPDEATYPRAFENTVVAFLIFSGIYLLISLTAAVLREQVTS